MRAVLSLGIMCAFLGAAAPAVAGPGVFQATATDLADPDSLVRAVRSKGASELSAEALAAYQEGMDAYRRGDAAAAAERFSDAVALDPSFPEADLALARIHLFSAPHAAVEDFWHATEAVSSSFGAQHLILINTVFGFLIVVALGGVLITLYTTARVLPRVHHTLAEVLKHWFPAGVAALVAVLVLAAPVAWRVGLVPVILLYSGLMWRWMDRGERRWAVTLVALTVVAPLLLWAFSPVLYSPLDPAGRPFLLNRAMSAPYSGGLVQALDRAVEASPEDPDLVFARALIERRGNKLDAAERDYRQALRYGADEASVYNNVGGIEFLRGHYDNAMQDFERSAAVGNGRAAPHFNLSQAFAKKLLFEKADQEMLEANRLSFSRIRAVLRNTDDSGSPLIDELLPTSAMWSAAMTGPRILPGLPGWMRWWFPGALVALPLVAIPLFVLGLVAGSRLHRYLPSFACTNCGRAVCRRCLRRIRRSAYCTSCGDALLRIQSTAYSRLVLDSRLRRNRSAASILPKAASWILPGFHASRLGHQDVAAALSMSFAVAAMFTVNDRLPVTRLAWLENGAGMWWPWLPLCALALVMVGSWLTVVKLKPAGGSAEAPETGPVRASVSDGGYLDRNRAA